MRLSVFRSRFAVGDLLLKCQETPSPTHRATLARHGIARDRPRAVAATAARSFEFFRCRLALMGRSPVKPPGKSDPTQTINTSIASIRPTSLCGPGFHRTVAFSSGFTRAGTGSALSTITVGIRRNHPTWPNAELLLGFGARNCENSAAGPIQFMGSGRLRRP